MTEPYRRPVPPGPGRRRLAVVLGAIVTILAAAALVWSIVVWPSTCGKYIPLPF